MYVQRYFVTGVLEKRDQLRIFVSYKNATRCDFLIRIIYAGVRPDRVARERGWPKTSPLLLAFFFRLCLFSLNGEALSVTHG